MTAWLSVLRTQFAHLRLPALLLDTITMAVVGMLAMFVLLLGSFQNADALIFEAGLRYDSRVALGTEHTGDLDTAPGFTIVSSETDSVIAATTFDDPDRHPADFSTSLQPTIWQFATEDLDHVQSLLATNILSGRASADGALIDEASAAQLDVQEGDQIVIHAFDSGYCRAKISGMVRTYREIGTDFVSGLLVSPESLCAQVISSSSTSAAAFVQFDASPSAAAAQSWSTRMLDLLRQSADFRVSGLLPAILLIGLGLWGLAGLRGSIRLRNQLAPSADLLAEIGCRRSRVRAPFLIVTAASSATAALGAAWGAHQALWSLASFYTQALHWISTGLVFAAFTFSIAAIAYTRSDRRGRLAPHLADRSTARPKGNR